MVSINYKKDNKQKPGISPNLIVLSVFSRFSIYSLIMCKHFCAKKQGCFSNIVQKSQQIYYPRLTAGSFSSLLTSANDDKQQRIKSFHNIKGNAQFLQKVTSEPLTDLKKKPLMEVGNITKADTCKSFLHLC